MVVAVAVAAARVLVDISESAHFLQGFGPKVGVENWRTVPVLAGSVFMVGSASSGSKTVRFAVPRSVPKFPVFWDGRPKSADFCLLPRTAFCLHQDGSGSQSCEPITSGSRHSRFRFTPVAGREPKPVMILTLRPEGGVWLEAEPLAGPHSPSREEAA